MNEHEINIVLAHSVGLENAVKDLSSAISAANQSNPYGMPGIVYKLADDKLGFSLRVHGRDLVPKYEQLRSHDGDFPELYARITLCFPDREGRPDQPVFAVLIDRNGRFSVDGTTNLRYDLAARQHFDYARQQLTLGIVAAVRKEMPIFQLS
jgi:hypothetical protein